MTKIQLFEQVLGDTFPNETRKFPLEEPRGEANTNGVKDVNHIQKNGTEAEKAESRGLRSGIYKPIKNTGWRKARSGSLTESSLSAEAARALAEGMYPIPFGYAWPDTVKGLADRLKVCSPEYKDPTAVAKEIYAFVGRDNE